MERNILGFLAALSIALCLAFPVLAFLGKMPEEAYKFGFFCASAAWFIFATLRVSRPRRPGRM